MKTPSRSLFFLTVCIGLLFTFWASAAMLSSVDHAPLRHIAQIVFGLVMAGSAGYAFLYPHKANSPTSMLFAAGVGFVLASVMFVFLLHFYGSTGFFSTIDSMSGVGVTALVVVVSVWLLFYSRFLREKGMS